MSENEEVPQRFFLAIIQFFVLIWITISNVEFLQFTSRDFTPDDNLNYLNIPLKQDNAVLDRIRWNFEQMHFCYGFILKILWRKKIFIWNILNFFFRAKRFFFGRWCEALIKGYLALYQRDTVVNVCFTLCKKKTKKNTIYRNYL